MSSGERSGIVEGFLNNEVNRAFRLHEQAVSIMDAGSDSSNHRQLDRSLGWHENASSYDYDDDDSLRVYLVRDTADDEISLVAGSNYNTPIAILREDRVDFADAISKQDGFIDAKDAKLSDIESIVNAIGISSKNRLDEMQREVRERHLKRRSMRRRLGAPFAVIALTATAVIAGPDIVADFESRRAEAVPEELAELEAQRDAVAAEVEQLEEERSELQGDIAVAREEIVVELFDWKPGSSVIFEADTPGLVPVTDEPADVLEAIVFDEEPEQEAFVELTTNIDENPLAFETHDWPCTKFPLEVSSGDQFVATRNGGKNNPLLINADSAENTIEICDITNIGSGDNPSYDATDATRVVVERIKRGQQE